MVVDEGLLGALTFGDAPVVLVSFWAVLPQDCVLLTICLMRDLYFFSILGDDPCKLSPESF